jgi:ankyrin repeat protein
MEDLLLNKGFHIDSIIDKQEKFTPMSLACHLDDLEMAHFLDIMGADIHSARGKQGYTPLMTSTNRFNTRMVDYLIERGANPLV